MSPTSAGNAPALSDDPFAYFRTPEFHARMRNLNEAMVLGMQPPHADMPSHLGCSIEQFMAYAATVTDANGIANIDVGGGAYVMMDLGAGRAGGESGTPSPLLVAASPDPDEALSVIIPRLIYLQKVCDHHGRSKGRPSHHYALNGLLCTFIDMDGFTSFRIDTSRKPRRPLMIGSYEGTIQDGKYVGRAHVEYWRRGWEDRLF